MIDLLRKIKVHPVLWMIFAVGGMTGLFKEIVMIFIIVLIHELGHAFMAYRFNWRIKRILLLPFGGMAETDEHGNRPVKEEILVILSGPMQHFWMIGASYLLVNTAIWSEGDHRIFLFHNITILCFNLIPVFPLDGGRLLFATQSLYFPFQKSFYYSFTLSGAFLFSITYGSLFVLPFHLNLVVIIGFLWIHHYLEWKQRHYHFLRFLLERKRFTLDKEVKPIDVHPTITVANAIKKIYREKQLRFSYRKGTSTVAVDEKILLQAFFQREKRLLPISQLAS